jgi:hypothetical protein
MDPAEPAAEARIRTAGRELVDSRPISRDVGAYREFIHASREEFTVATDVYMRPRSEWFSDRSVCYLAAAKPVVTRIRPSGSSCRPARGCSPTPPWRRPSTRSTNADYSRHATAARRVAAEYFGAERVLGRLLADAGLA